DGAGSAGDADIEIVPRLVSRLDAVAVIVELAERDHLGQRFEASDMIAMPMANHHMIDSRQARLLCGGQDALGVTVAIAWIASVNQQRFSSWRDEQRGSAPFDIDPGDFQIARLGERGTCRERERGNGGGKKAVHWCPRFWAGLTFREALNCPRG